MSNILITIFFNQRKNQAVDLLCFVFIAGHKRPVGKPFYLEIVLFLAALDYLI